MLAASAVSISGNRWRVEAASKMYMVSVQLIHVFVPTLQRQATFYLPTIEEPTAHVFQSL